MTTPGCPAVLCGAAAGLLFGDGELDPEALVVCFRGHLQSARNGKHEGPAFLRGLLHAARSVLWLVPEVVASLHEVFREWEEDVFVAVLPEFRLAFADLTPRECDHVAQCVAATAVEPSAVALLATGEIEGFNEQDLLRGLAVDRQVLEILRHDSLEDDND